MGNCSICNDNSRVRRENVNMHERNERQAKKEFKRLALCPLYNFSSLNQTEVTERFSEFHEKELTKLIKQYKFLKAGKDFVQLGYDLTFVSFNQLEKSISKDADLKQLEKLLSRQIRQDIEESKEKSIIYQIVRKFHIFFESIIVEKTENYYDSKQEYSSPDIQYSPTKSKSFEIDGINRRTIQYALMNDIQLSQCIILSMASLFALLKSALNHTYKEIVNQFPSNWDTYTKKEMFLQKIIQHFIYDKQLILGQVLDLALNNYYSYDQQEPLHLDDNIEKLTYLDISLYPEPGQVTIIKEIENDSWLMVENSNKNLNDLRTSSRMSLIEMQSKVIKAINEVEKVNLPYKELFVFFQKLMEEKKPYRLYQFMERLNDTIVDVYMTKRPAEDLEKYREVILTEDNRLQIILFLIHKFQETSECDIRKKLFHKLKFMMDFDQVLDRRIKFEMDQSFVRFYACMEMIVQTY